MRQFLLLALTTLLVACGAPVAVSPTPAPPAPTSTPPGQFSPTVTPGGSTPTPMTPDVSTPRAPSPTTVASSAPLASLGFGHAFSAAVISGADAVAVGTSAGVLYLRLANLEPLRFVALDATVGELAVSPGGRYTAAGLGDAVRLIDERGSTVLTLPGSGPVFSPGAALLAVVETASNGPPTTSVVRVPSGEPVAALQGGAPVFSPDGRLLATVAGDTVRLWSMPGGQPAGEHAGQGAAFAPDGSALAVSGPGGLALLSLREDRIGAPSFTLQEQVRAATFGEGPGELFAWLGAEIVRLALPTGERLGALTGFYAGPGGIGPAGRLAWNIESGGESPPRLLVLRQDGAIVHADGAAGGGRPFFSADGRTLVVLDDSGTIAAYELDAGPLATRQVAGYGALAFASEGAIVAARRGATGVDRWTLQAARPERSLELTGDSLDRVRELTAQGEQVFVEREEGSYLGGILLLALERWEAGTDEPALLRAEELPFDQLSLEDRVPWDFSPATGLLARGVAPSAGGGVLVDDPAGGAPRALPVLRGVPAEARPLAIAFSPDGARLAVGYDNGTLLIVNVTDLGPVAAGPFGDGAAIESLTWSGDGRFIAMATADGGVAVWEAGDDDRPRRFSAPQGDGWPPALALSDDGAVLAAGSRGGLAVFDLARGSEVLRLGIPVEGVALAPDGRQTAATSRGQIVVWQVP